MIFAPYRRMAALMLLGLVGVLLIWLPGGAQAEVGDDTPAHADRYISGEVLVRFRPGGETLQAQGEFLGLSIQVLETSPSGLVRLSVPEGREEEMAALLRARDDVEAAGPNNIVYTMEAPNDPYYVGGYQWGLDKVRAPEAWSIATGGSAVVIAVIDTGVDMQHADLESKLVGGKDYIDGDSSPHDEHGHGTHVAGIAAATTNNGLGVAGMSWGARIMPIRVLDATGTGSLYNVLEGMEWAADNGARILNLSLGCENCGHLFVNTIDYVRARGVLIVAAAGNCGDPDTHKCGAHNVPIYPAANAGVLAVGATDEVDQRASFSNYGDYLDVAAPGVWIISTCRSSTYCYKHGTSMATPHVAGLAALVWSVHPTLTQDQVQEFIEQGALDLGAVGWDAYFGWGRIDAFQTLLNAAASAGGLEPRAFLPLLLAAP